MDRPATDWLDSAWRMARLAWSPRSLPEAALNVPLLSGLKGGFVGWFLLMGLLCAPSGAMQRPMQGWGECALAVVATGISCGLGGSLMMMTLLLLLVPIVEDETTPLGRAQLNVWLMVPFCALPAAMVWAFVAATSDPRVDVRAAAPWWSAWAPARWLASPAWLLVLALMMLACVAWAHASVRWRLTSGRCIGCGYPLIGLAERRCPECGRDALPGQQVELLNPPPRAQ